MGGRKAGSVQEYIRHIGEISLFIAGPCCSLAVITPLFLLLHSSDFTYLRTKSNFAKKITEIHLQNVLDILQIFVKYVCTIDIFTIRNDPSPSNPHNSSDQNLKMSI